MDTTGKLSSKHEHGTLNTNRSRMAAAERVFGASGLASPASVLARGRDQSWGLVGFGVGVSGFMVEAVCSGHYFIRIAPRRHQGTARARILLAFQKAAVAEGSEIRGLRRQSPYRALYTSQPYTLTPKPSTLSHIGEILVPIVGIGGRSSRFEGTKVERLSTFGFWSVYVGFWVQGAGGSVFLEQGSNRLRM